MSALLPSPFRIEGDSDARLLYFDIFHKNNELVLICPVYTSHIEYLSTIRITHKGVVIPQKTAHVKIEYEPIAVLIFDFPVTDTDTHEVCVEYKGVSQTHTLVHTITSTKNMLSLTTLFKDDYKHIDLFYEYYKRQGVGHFYMYYNGKPSKELLDLYAKPDITLIEWDFQYWNDKARSEFPHHAQPAQIHHAIYRYGKQNTEYMIFCDMDEYMYIPGKTLYSLVESKTVDLFGFHNHWCKTVDGTIPTSFPTRILRGPIWDYGDRSKNIHRMDTLVTTGVHSNGVHTTTPIRFDKGHVLLHFKYWSGHRSAPSASVHRITPSAPYRPVYRGYRGARCYTSHTDPVPQNNEPIANDDYTIVDLEL